MRLSFGRRDPEFVAVRNDENHRSSNKLLALLRRDEYGQSAKSDRFAYEITEIVGQTGGSEAFSDRLRKLVPPFLGVSNCHALTVMRLTI